MNMRDKFKFVTDERNYISFPTTEDFESIDSVIDKAGNEVFDWVLSVKKDTDKNVA